MDCITLLRNRSIVTHEHTDYPKAISPDRLNHTCLTTHILIFTSTCRSALFATAAYVFAKRCKVNSFGRSLTEATKHELFRTQGPRCGRVHASVAARVWILAQAERWKTSHFLSTDCRQAGPERRVPIAAPAARWMLAQARIVSSQ